MKLDNKIKQELEMYRQSLLEDVLYILVGRDVWVFANNTHYKIINYVQ